MVSALIVLVLAWLLAMIARRVLGVPVGWPRSIAVGVLMILSFGAMAQYLAASADIGGVDGSAVKVPAAVVLMFLTLAVVWVFALGVAILVGLEVAVPTGSLPKLSSFFRGWRARRQRTRRYAEVVGIAMRHGLGSQLRGLNRNSRHENEEETALHLRLALNEAGVTFVKLGQMLSTRRDLLSEPYIRELSKLQTHAEPEPWSAIEPAIRTYLGRDLDEVFAWVNPEPLASASVAQVHEGSLLSGQVVVLKVQRPLALRQVRRDMDIVLRMAHWLDRSAPWARTIGVKGLAEGFAASLREELNYHVELENMRSVGASLAEAGAGDVRVPHAYEEFSGSRLLVMDKLEGRPISHARGVLSGMTEERRHEVATKLLSATLTQIVDSGVFHADLHPGNIFLRDDGGIGLLDFGSVGRLDPSTRQSLGTLLYAVEKDDSVAATDALIELLDRPEELNERALERGVGQLLTRYRTGFGGLGSRSMFTVLLNLLVQHGFAVPPQIAAAFRALAALEGTLGQVCPGFDVVAAARAEGRRMMAHQFRPGNLKDQLESRALQLLPLLERMPRRLNKLTEDLEQGRFSMNIRMLADSRDRHFLDTLVQQVVVALLASAATLGAIILIASDTGPMLTESVRMHAFFGYTLLFAGFVLSLRAVALVFRRHPENSG
ncbi:ABC1 kinase family protein [Arthrobacter mangrovi]|uniref:Ubiquinone biosynthesis protein UbiB n=1 Tax=Arthrobacter mangrovi TaxID=2966350 RepID=A0ABQ5MRZ5_9MICC|nr:AarF/ABC1/UbiB kinase family protein [Arthrobacter mangrovi]GLB66733.1 ubiquinone biosynthesis protein UbiB [Arthrobacter mangrovi]